MKATGPSILADNVYMGLGPQSLGKHIGKNVAIGADTVVTKDAPDNAVAVSSPGRMTSGNGSTGDVMNTDCGISNV